MLEQIMMYLEALDRQASESFKESHPEYVYHGRIKRKLRCYFGDIWISRGRYRCKGKKDIYPLDRFLPEGAISRFIEELALDLVTEISYGRSQRFLKRYTGVDLSSMSTTVRLK